ncbi:hypothetical protein, partial [Methylobacterium sp. J-068]|uniref:hypothetical protein n=1 Tax=Methylobacterium sp. J-068 TaxID=2836649 RepID=UPI001FB90ACA
MDPKKSVKRYDDDGHDRLRRPASDPSALITDADSPARRRKTLCGLSSSSTPGRESRIASGSTQHDSTGTIRLGPVVAWTDWLGLRFRFSEAGGTMLSDAQWSELEPLVEACRPKAKTP